MKVRWADEAKQNQLEILGYIGTRSPNAALKLDQLFRSAAAKLAIFPLLGQAGSVPNTRELIPHENYRIVYEVDDQANTVWILAVVHTSRRWPPEQP